MAIMELRLTATGMMSLARGIVISVTSTMTVLHITLTPPSMLETLTLSAAAKVRLDRVHRPPHPRPPARPAAATTMSLGLNLHMHQAARSR
jgi:hypothetical protein